MSDIFDAVRRAAEEMGSCDPLWLGKRKAPEFKTAEPGGNGPTVILLHGLFGALSNWDSVLPHLQKFCTPIALHFPLVTGHRSEVKVKALAAYTEFFIRKRKFEKVILCGNSLGGHVAMRLYLATPSLVPALILSGTSGLYEHSPDSLPVRPDRVFIKDHMKRVFYHDKFITDQAIEDIYSTIKERVNVLNIIHAARSAKKDNLSKYLPSIKAPTLLLWGKNDEVTTMDVAHTFRNKIPSAQLKVIDQCGHAPMIEHPEWFAKQMRAFIESL